MTSIAGYENTPQKFAFVDTVSIPIGYCDAAANALIIYEFLLTCDEELNLVLRAGRRRLLPTLLFLTNRLCLLGYVITASFSGAVKANIAFGLILTTTVALVSALRVYAISNRHSILAGVTFTLASATVVVNLYKDIKYLPWVVSDPVRVITALEQGDFLKIVIASRVCAIASDLLAFAVVWRYSFGLHREAGVLRWSAQATITRVLLRDGTVFFLALLLISVLEIISWALKMYLVSNFIAPLMSILTSRFLMNLRRAASASTYKGDAQCPSYVRDDVDSAAAMSSIEFASADFVVTRRGDPEVSVGWGGETR